MVNLITCTIGLHMYYQEDERVIAREEGLEYAHRMSAMFIETSAKTKIGIQQAFDELVEKVGMMVVFKRIGNDCYPLLDC